MTEPVLYEAIGVIDGVNVDFNTPVAYQPGTLFAYLNGELVQQSGTEGPIETGGTSVRMRESPRDGDTLHFYFDTGPPISGVVDFVSPPYLLSSVCLLPRMSGSINLHPNQISATGEDEENIPIMTTAEDLAPESLGASDLKPTMISAEEI